MANKFNFKKNKVWVIGLAILALFLFLNNKYGILNESQSLISFTTQTECNTYLNSYMGDSSCQCVSKTSCSQASAPYYVDTYSYPSSAACSNTNYNCNAACGCGSSLCTDPDKGSNAQFTKTTVVGVSESKTDYCLNINEVLEFSCAADDNNPIGTLTPCAGTCSNGACVSVMDYWASCNNGACCHQGSSVEGVNCCYTLTGVGSTEFFPSRQLCEDFNNNCIPKTCSDYPNQCGIQSNGCGNYIQCSCGSGFACNTNFVCESLSGTCSGEGQKCKLAVFIGWINALEKECCSNSGLVCKTVSITDSMPDDKLSISDRTICVKEGSCIPTTEFCGDNKDNDCDNLIDENCGSCGVCSSTCKTGTCTNGKNCINGVCLGTTCTCTGTTCPSGSTPQCNPVNGQCCVTGGVNPDLKPSIKASELDDYKLNLGIFNPLTSFTIFRDITLYGFILNKGSPICNADTQCQSDNCVIADDSDRATSNEKKVYEIYKDKIEDRSLFATIFSYVDIANFIRADVVGNYGLCVEEDGFSFQQVIDWIKATFKIESDSVAYLILGGAALLLIIVLIGPGGRRAQ